MTYRALVPFLAVTPHAHSRFLTLPAGSVLRVVGTPDQAGLVDAVHEERLISVFMRDLEEKCDQIKKASASGAIAKASKKTV